MNFMVSYDPMIGEDTARNTQKLTMALHNPDVSRDHSVGVCVGKPAPHVEIQIEPSNYSIKACFPSNVTKFTQLC